MPQITISYHTFSIICIKMHIFSNTESHSIAIFKVSLTKIVFNVDCVVDMFLTLNMKNRIKVILLFPSS